MHAISVDRSEGALAQLYEIYRPRLGGFLYRLSSDPEVVEQIFNDVMLTVWNKAHQFQGNSKVSSWIFTIGHRRFLSLIRKQKMEQRLRSALEHVVGTGSAGTEDDAQGEVDNRRWLDKALLQLPAKQRLVVEMKYYTDASYEEIAAVAGCPVNTVKTHIHHARKRLRAVLEEQGSSAEPAAKQVAKKVSWS